MKNKDNINLISSLILGLIFFLIFAYQIEYNRSFFTWLYLLLSIIYFLNIILIGLRKILLEVIELKKIKQDE